ncbi:MAG: LytTR family DNA-binding domain-containing protein [Tannerella sp.]|jgi:DNA-binding LytR/AlgR family response regulator|nr:LytTR family DNA-binding domain-containing protein [Tannerella sp.]
MIDCIIIEDEPLAIDKLVNYIAKMPSLRLLQTFNSPIPAIEYLAGHQVGLIFLDIEMKELTGIQLLESIRQKPEIIITTAYEQYALKGFDLQVCDYLLKPIPFERFVQAVNKAAEEINRTVRRHPNRIFVKTEYRLESIDIGEILFIEAMGDYRRIVTESKKIMTLQSFSELYAMLPHDTFCRVHQSFLVSLDKIEKIERNRIYIKGNIIPVSTSYSDDFYRLISGN